MCSLGVRLCAGPRVGRCQDAPCSLVGEDGSRCACAQCRPPGLFPRLVLELLSEVADGRGWHVTHICILQQIWELALSCEVSCHPQLPKQGG